MTDFEEQTLDLSDGEEPSSRSPRFGSSTVASVLMHGAIFGLVLHLGRTNFEADLKESVFVVDLAVESSGEGVRIGGGEPAQEPAPGLLPNPPEPVAPQSLQSEPAVPQKVLPHKFVPQKAVPQKVVKVAPRPKPAASSNTAEDTPPVSSERSASETTGPAAARADSSAAGVSPRSGAEPGAGSGQGGADAARTEYSALLLEQINRHKVYPGIARKRGIEGRTVLRLVLHRNGSPHSYEIVTSSGADVLDDSAKEIVAASSPFPPFPDSIPGDTATFLVPIEFRLARSWM